jgi:uroporphyrinogen-III synthase
MRVIVTRPAGEAAEWVQSLQAHGFEAIALPLIDIQPVRESSELAAAWAHVAACRAAMFVSANAVRAFFSQRAACVWPSSTRAWSTGPGTRAALVEAGVPAGQIDGPPAQAPRFDSEALWEQVASQAMKDTQVLIVRGGEAGDTAGSGRDWLGDSLRAAGVRVRTVLAYTREAPAFTVQQRELALAAAVGDAAWIFSSSQAIAYLRAWLPQQDWSAARAVASHSRIAQAAREAGFGVVCESRPTVDAVTAALESLR